MNRAVRPTDSGHVALTVALEPSLEGNALARLVAALARDAGFARHVQLLRMDDLDLADARNSSIDQADGRWITFLAAGDRVDQDYLEQLVRATSSQSAAAMLVASRSGEGTRRPNRELLSVVDLRRHPLVHDRVTGAVFDVSVLRATGTRFRPSLAGPIGEADFCARYLLAAPAPLVAHVAVEHVPAPPRRRFLGPEGSARQGAYARALRGGLLTLLEDAQNGHGGVAPTWLQHLVVHQLTWLFDEESSQAGPSIEDDTAAVDDFHRAMASIVERLDPATVETYAARRLEPVWRDLLLHGYDAGHWHQTSDLGFRSMPDEGLVRLTYRYVGSRPPERLVRNGRDLRPLHAKVRVVPFFGGIRIRERILWLDADASTRLVVGEDDLGAILGLGPSSGPPPRRSRGIQRTRRRLSDRVIARLARSRLVRRWFGSAWVLMDRITDARDNGEHLFRYLRERHPSVNAWFVLDRRSHDWPRLRREFGSKVVAHGSLRWKILMKNGRHLVSSHVDRPILEPEAMRGHRTSWRFTFLQHGVIQSDLSRWLNRKPIDLFITSTHAERASIAGDGTPYVFTTKEVHLTGLPRFDRLLELHRASDPQQWDLVVVAPTWRAKLAPTVTPGSPRRVLQPDFATSVFANEWMRVVASDMLKRAVEQHGVHIALLLHPNFQDAASQLAIPRHVHTLQFASEDVQEVLARCRLLITDYSSIAFDAAYIERPVVYFQFDADQILGGQHVGRAGYFDYRRDGFGPVADDAEDAVRLALRVLDTGLEPRYARRAVDAFVPRDSGCRARVASALLRLDGNGAADLGEA